MRAIQKNSRKKAAVKEGLHNEQLPKNNLRQKRKTKKERSGRNRRQGNAKRSSGYTRSGPAGAKNRRHEEISTTRKKVRRLHSSVRGELLGTKAHRKYSSQKAAKGKGNTGYDDEGDWRFEGTQRET